MAKSNENQRPNIVLGKISDKNNRPLSNLIVQVYDRDMRGETLLSETITDRDGNYQTTWLREQLGEREKKSADLLIKVFSKGNKDPLFVSDIDNVRFNAHQKENINITINNVIEKNKIEYDDILKQVTILAEKVAIVDLQENKKNPDITFLSRETEINATHIEYLVVAHRLQELTKIDAAFFYALLRKDTLLRNDFVKTLQARISIGINTEIKPLLLDAALVDAKTIEKDVQAAAKELIVSEQVVKEIKRNIEQLKQYKKEAEEYYKNDHTNKIIDTITRFVSNGKIKEVGKLFQENKNDMVGFLNKVTDVSFFNNDDTKPKETKLDADLAQIFGFGNDLIPGIIKVNDLNKRDDIRKLAKFNKQEWVTELSKGKKTINAREKKLIDQTASNVVRKLEKLYPTTAFTAQLEREKKSTLKNRDAILSFLTKHEDFELTKNNIDLYLRDKKVNAKDSDLIREELKSVQRVFKLVPNYSKTNALLNQKIHSSQSIVAIGKTRFVNEIAPKAGIEKTEAISIYKKAEKTNTAAMLIVGELQDSMSAMDIASLETSSLSPKLEAVSKDFPNLKSLFKLTDTCACEHCRSVYSPAAYLVELLQFLDKRSVTDLTATPVFTANVAKDVLFERRPDLGDIDLGCENANTPLKYIDLVCELLEETIAPDTGINFTGDLSDGADKFQGIISAGLLSTLQTAGLPVTDKALIFETEVTTGSADTLPHYLRDTKAVCKIINTGGNNYTVFRLRQTLSPADELAAAPEYVNEKAYDILRNNDFAFKLPFDLNHVEAKAYFNRFDISRADLMRDFQVASVPSEESIAAEKLGLTDSERNLIITAKATIAGQQEIWNAPAQWDDPPVAGNVLAYMKRVDHFTEKTGLTYKELDLFLTLKYIDPNGVLFIKSLDLSCDTTLKEIAGLDAAVLDRMHRFLRLQKKTGWKMQTLDEIISQKKLGNTILDNNCLIKAATLLTISEKTGIKIDELIGFYDEIPNTQESDFAPIPLYQQIFLNKAKNGFSDENLLPENVNGTQLINNIDPTLAVYLQLKQLDYEKLLPLVPNNDLTFVNLSYLFASAKLIKKLKVKADDYVILTELTNINVSESPQKTLDFVEAVEIFKKSPLKLADVKYLIRHEATLIPDLEEKTKTILEKLQKEYQNNFTINKSPFNATLTSSEQKETLQNNLAKLSDVTEEDVKIFVGFIDKIWTSANDAKTFVDTKLAVLFDTTNIKNEIDGLEAVAGTMVQDILDHETALLDLIAAQEQLKSAVTPVEITNANNAIAAAEAQLLITTPKYNIASGLNLLQAFLETIALFQIAIGKQNILEANLATGFKSEPEIIKTVLKFVELKKPAPGAGLISEILQSDTLIDTDIPHVIPLLPAITNIVFADQYASIKLLNKLLSAVSAFKFNEEYLSWFLENNLAMGWFELDAIPYDVAQVVIDYQKYIDFAVINDLAKQNPPVINPADAESPISFLSVSNLFLPGSTATKAQIMETIALLTGYDATDIDAIDTYLFPVFDLANYRNVNNLNQLFTCAEYLRKLDSDISQIQEYIKPVLSTADVSILRTALKSRYDEDTWLNTLKEIMDVIRPQKRNALVAYILATNPEMKDENDLFDYFLVDIEMESCMPSSRIVQAHGSIQLFVQRCLMGLEPKAAADVDNDVNWNQWKWMKNYRVWEANRKVFLYPENWIEADLRDDKSFIFTEFENELQQNELTDLTAENALIRYLEKLDNIAYLEVVATWYQTDIKTMHVFARTKGGDPSLYYYRRFEQERYWTPWEKVELDISGNQLLAFVRNNRLCLAWPLITEEADPNQGAVFPDQNDTTSEQPLDKPRKKIKIQLCISEFANNKWQPKKISADGMLTPSNYTTDVTSLDKDKYNMLYFESFEQVWFFTTWESDTYEYHEYNGIFNLTGCKGYPELVFQGNASFPDFYPDFKDTLLKSQRYNERNYIPGDELAVRNGLSLFQFYTLLNKTPGNFRLTYPHQFTYIDLVVLMFEYLMLLFYKGNSDRKSGLKIPLGTLLPYFKENSKQGYVIIPGFYGMDKDPDTGDPIEVKRTGSNVMQLIEDIIALFNKYLALYNADPAQDLNVLFETFIADNDYQEIVAEIGVYLGLQYGEQFKNMYHPLLCSLRKTMYKDGIPELMKRNTQLQKTTFDFKVNYDPNTSLVPPLVITNPDGTKSTTYPQEDLDFTTDGSYSCYNWELFFHVPFLMATRLTKNQRFEDALTWFHYMFNPTGALSGTTPQKYWVTKPFYLNQESDYINQRIDTLLYKIADPSTPERIELEFAIDQWRNDPFKPHTVARFRPVAYQKALLMKYLDNLTEWGDYLFRQDTMESIAQATQMYILADKILGPKPKIIPSPIKQPYETYNQIENKIDAFGNALIDLENILPDFTVLPEGGDEITPPAYTLSMLYFCVPANEKMAEYWDRIADRLFKIRHCQNIEGVERSLALFAPPIDPAMLVRAAASGLDLSSVIAGMNAPTPYYRFNILAQKAMDLTQEVRGLGGALLQALEKKDAEAMALLRNELEMQVLNAVKDVKLLQIKESTEQIEILKRTKKVTEERKKYYAGIEKIISKEQTQLDKLEEASEYQTESQIVRTVAGALALIPEFHIGASGFGGSPQVVVQLGGSAISKATNIGADILNILSSIASYEANRASINGGFERRFADWKLQERLADKELASIEKQISAAGIRKDIAITDLKNHELQITNAKKSDEFMRNKFTNKELYDWMIGQISSVYFSAYKLAHDFAKKAERSYKFELGNDDTFISYGYWDSMKKGLQSADRLIHDIKRMETSYLDKNKREYEITKHVSLAQLDPLALIRLRATGVCDFEIPEVMFDMDHAGQFFRRIKSVSLSLPCIAGPYTSVSAKLSLVNNRYRKNTNSDNAAGTGYAEDPGNDERFVYNVGTIQSIAASSSQNDSGVFELNFKDERYLPFEGTGAISSWRLELPTAIRQYDYNTISDVIVQIKYTSREGGSGLKSLANTTLKDRLALITQQLSQEGLHISTNLKHDMPNEWHLLKTNGTVNLTIPKSRLPFIAQTADALIEDVTFVAKVTGNPGNFTLNIDGSDTNLARIDAWQLCSGVNSAVELDGEFVLVVEDIGELEELVMVVKVGL